MAFDIRRHEHLGKSDFGLMGGEEALSDQSPISRRPSLRSFWKLRLLCSIREGRFQLPFESRPTVIVIEDDPSVRRSLRRLIATAGFSVQTFDRPSTFLQSNPPISNVCYVIDIHLPEMTGVAFTREDESARCGRRRNYG